MPVYEYYCAECKVRSEHWARLSERHEPQPCKRCGVPAPYVISAPRVFGDYQPYESPASGRIIEGRRARREDFAQTGTRPYEDGEREQAILRAAAAEREEEAQIDHAVEKTLHEMTL